jgi:TRAP-type C4-dicarboxylate transport system permease small subunit
MSSKHQPPAIFAVLRQIERFEGAVTFSCFLLLIAAVFADVVSRELVGTGLHWARQVGVYANLMVIMFGIGLASAAGTHLRPRFADNWLPVSWSGVLDRLQDVVMALFCLGFAGFSVSIVYEGFMLGERSAVLGTLIWPFQAVMPLVFLIAAFRHGVYALYPGWRPVAMAAPDFNDGSKHG